MPCRVGWRRHAIPFARTVRRRGARPDTSPGQHRGAHHVDSRAGGPRAQRGRFSTPSSIDARKTWRRTPTKRRHGSTWRWRGGRPASTSPATLEGVAARLVAVWPLRARPALSEDVVSRSGTRPSRRVVAGFGGDLISHAYVEQELLPAAAGMLPRSLGRVRTTTHPLVAPGVALARARVFGPHGPGRRGSAAAAAARSRSAGRDTAPVGPVRIGIRLGRLAHRVAVVDPGADRVARRGARAALPATRHGRWSATADRCGSSTARARGLASASSSTSRSLTASPKGVVALWWLANADGHAHGRRRIAARQRRRV